MAKPQVKVQMIFLESLKNIGWRILEAVSTLVFCKLIEGGSLCPDPDLTMNTFIKSRIKVSVHQDPR